MRNLAEKTPTCTYKFTPVEEQAYNVSTLMSLLAHCIRKRI